MNAVALYRIIQPPCWESLAPDEGLLAVTTTVSSCRICPLREVEQSARVTQRQHAKHVRLYSEHKRGQLTIFTIIILAAWLLSKSCGTALVHYIYIAEYDYGLQTK
ncbi:Hypothetical_protein [Hexamita inflata]|uniref:Hypothetical_protein n=1 Tax=Hexamita inflata TaxID=28002 RepID=A0AA86UPP9_9EUKA|nr:Hypothetical protein HINF_LOCUS54435 [Hexamita inflata]